jgi:hypothetical protein
LPGVKNVTVSIPEAIYRAARIRAAERGTSVSALVAGYLESLAAADAEFARLEAQERRIRAEIGRFRASDRLNRDELHDRALR